MQGSFIDLNRIIYFCKPRVEKFIVDLPPILWLLYPLASGEMLKCIQRKPKLRQYKL